MTAARAEFAEVVPPRVVLRPRAVDDSGFVIRARTRPDGPAYRVVGERPARWVRQTDFTNDEAVGYLADRLGRLGVEEALSRPGPSRATPCHRRGRRRGRLRLGADADQRRRAARPARERPAALRVAARPTRDEKRESAHDRYVARQATQSDLEAERRAGHWATARDETDED